MVVPVTRAPSVRRASLALALILAIYLSALLWTDRQDVLPALNRAAGMLKLLIPLALAAFLIRAWRWRWLLARAGHALPPGTAALIYLAGFAFTATPGKLGELIRLRYLGPHGVPAHIALGEFLFERCFDLLVVMLLTLLAAAHVAGTSVAIAFALIIVGGVVVAAARPQWLHDLARRLKPLAWQWPAQFLDTLARGLIATRLWMNLPGICVTSLTGLAAWSLTSLGLALLVSQELPGVDFLTTLAIYPVAMLAGAASMLPAGLGTTEAAAVAILTSLGLSVAASVLLAVVVRLATLWLAIALGVVCMIILERQQAHHVVLKDQ
jgi:uncharacterized membrane protein YbhN (UPF0104 family)